MAKHLKFQRGPYCATIWHLALASQKAAVVLNLQELLAGPWQTRRTQAVGFETNPDEGPQQSEQK